MNVRPALFALVAVTGFAALGAAQPGGDDGEAGHLQAHEHLQAGRYAAAVAAIRDPVRPGTPAEGTVGSPPFCPVAHPAHRHHLAAFAAGMMGASGIALEEGFAAARAVAPDANPRDPALLAAASAGSASLVRFGRWDEILAEPLPGAEQRFPTAMAYYARGIAFAARRRWAEARAARDSIAGIAAGYPDGDGRLALAVAERALTGEIALRRGARDEAVRVLEEAVAREDRLGAATTPLWLTPTRHSLGVAYLESGRPDQAERVYREDLERHPENGWALHGLATAQVAQGRMAAARETLARFEAAWAAADIRVKGSRF